MIRDGHGEFAIKNDIDQLKNVLKSDIELSENRLKSDIELSENRLKAELTSRIEHSENELKVEISQLKTNVSWLKWIGGIQIAVAIAAATVVVSILK